MYINYVENLFSEDKQYKLFLDECMALHLYTNEVDEECLYELQNIALCFRDREKRDS